MEKLRNGNFIHQIATAEEVKEFTEWADRLIEKYGLHDRKVSPYGYPENVTKLVNTVKDYTRCTFGSKQYLILLANGLIEIMSEWERQELQPKVTVRVIRNGKIKTLCEEFARILIEDGVAEAV